MNRNSLEVLAGDLLRQHGLWLSVAESCSGGLLGHRITNVPGSSDYFLGGVIAYDNQIKMRLLGVRSETLEKHGAVSREVVLEMAQGVRTALQADVGLSVSGIAGPGGGTDEKPVGLVWIGLSASGSEDAWSYTWAGNRLQVKEQTAEQALRILVDYLEGLNPDRKPVSARKQVSPTRKMDEVDVMAYFNSQGEVTPVEVRWRGQLFPIQATGRQWRDHQGQHFLVMLPGERVGELVFSPVTMRWRLHTPPPTESVS